MNRKALVLVLLFLYAATIFAKEKTVHQLSGAAISPPTGAYARYDRHFSLGETHWKWGLYNQFLILSNELGVQLKYTAQPEWIVVTLETGFEPGFYRKKSGSGLPARTLGWRWNVRAQTIINLEIQAWRLYSRSTAHYRTRDFIEVDTFQGIEVKNERALEQATALLYKIYKNALEETWWVYGEYTVGHLFDFGTRPDRLSGGVVTKNWLSKNLNLNLDFFYSFAPPPIDGFGFILAFWYTW